MRLLIVVLLLFSYGCTSASFEENQLPSEAVAALQSPDSIVLYSLEPWDVPTTNDATLHHFKILGQTTLNAENGLVAVAALESAVPATVSRAGIHPLCFDPRVALRVRAHGQTYDFLLCYACGYLYVYRGDENIAMLYARGSPDVLNSLLTKANIPLSKSGQ
jgi:hypothetical protein